jgi:membrane-associated phospholipid phosphatase
MNALRRCTLSALLATLLLSPSLVFAEGPRRSVGNAVTHWNTIATAAILVDPGRIRDSRTMAVVQAAIHDAVNAIDRRYQPYTTDASAPGASLDAAVAAAARDVLMVLSPSRAGITQAAYDAALAQIPDRPGKAAGIALGQRCAFETLKRREADGLADAEFPIYVPTAVPGDYAFTPPFSLALYPGWGQLEPWAIKIEDHRVPGPDPLNSLQYALDYNYLKAVGSLDSPWRTADQTEIARFWGEASPAGWNRIANSVIRDKHLNPWKSARILALVNFAIADGFIASFAAKYEFRFWRPSTAIQHAFEDGNALTEQDASWQPLFSTPPLVSPPIPEYPSNHAVVGAAAAEVLAHFFGDRVRFSTTSTSLPGVTRHFRGFTEAAVENGISRAYAGIHFIRAIDDGYWQGRGIGRRVERLLPPVD